MTPGRALIVTLLSIALPTAALADPPARQAAKELLAQGAKDFRLGDFERAIDDFKRSYDFYPDPLALYNIAQVYRQQKNAEKALFFYQQYLTEAPHAPDAAKIEQRIAELKEVIAAQKRVADRPPDGVQPSTATAPDVSSPSASTPTTQPAPTSEKPVADTRGRPLYQWAVAGGGLALAGVGVGLLVNASQLDDDAHHATSASAALDLHDQASSRRGIGTALTIGGSVIAAAGVVLLIWNPGDRKHDAAATSALIVGPSSIGVRGSF